MFKNKFKAALIGKRKFEKQIELFVQSAMSSKR